MRGIAELTIGFLPSIPSLRRPRIEQTRSYTSLHVQFTRMGQSNSSSTSSSLILRRPKPSPSSSSPHAIFSIPLIVHLILTFTPADAYSPLLVSSAWYQSFIPILYHTAVLRTQSDLHALFRTSAPSGPHPNLKREALFHVRRIVLLAGESPAASPPPRELEMWAKGARERDNWCPRLNTLQFGYDRQGLRDLGSGLIGLVDGRGHSLAGEVARLLRVVYPKEVLFEPTHWGRLVDPAEENDDAHRRIPELHAILHPSTLTRLANLLSILYERSNPPTTISHSHLFFHQLAIHQQHAASARPPTPTFLLPETPVRLRLHFAPLSSLPVEGEQGPSLNPWDRRVVIVREACRQVGPDGEVSVRGVGRGLREELRAEALRKAEGVAFGSLVFVKEKGEGRLTGEEREEQREVPDL